MNTMRVITVSLLLIFSVFTTVAQSTGSCASDALNDTLLAHDPIFNRSFHYMEHMLSLQQDLNPNERTTDIYTLPVVVHVIHTGQTYGTGANITDEQIYSAIAAMNNDYRHVSGTNGFGSGPDIGIEFCLAVRDPNGQPTTGIVRVDGSSVPLYATQGIEASGGNGAIEESVKALSTWPRTSYMNIWVVTEIENNDGGSGIQGYAYFPINSPIDGIVVLYNAFGTVGNLKSYTNLNRTITHEAGHYLGLYHTFNGTSTCGAESDCANMGDHVCDTPVTIQSTSCTSPACSGTQQVQNYMDYTTQTCQNMFTEGQKLRMRTTLETQRTSMITSMGCMPVYTNDIGITSILSPTGTNCQGALSPQVTLANFGSSTLTSAVIHYNIDGSGNNTYNWTGSINSGTSLSITLGSITPTSGSHTLYAWTSNPNGISDQNTSNDQSTGDFSISSGSPANLDVVLDYYGAETTWSINDSNGNQVMYGGPYANGQQGLHNITPVCLAPACYTLVMTDAYGDGQGFTNGSFTLTSSTGSVLATGSGNWGGTSTNNFCITGTSNSGSAPVASFTISDNTLCPNSTASFTNTSTNTPTSYSWTFESGSPSTSTSQNPQNISFTTPGNYDVTLTATNANGSNTYTCVNCITVNALPVVTLTGINPLCAVSANGSVTSSVTGSAPYTYAWSNGATSSSINSLTAGNYTVTVTDANGCTKQSTSTLTAPSAITIAGTAANATCSGTTNGMISVSATGGTGAKTFSWSNGSTGAVVNNLGAGNYTVTATDANACTSTQSYTISIPTAISITGSVTNATCSGLNNGSISISSAGGTGTKTYAWSNGASGAVASNLGTGNYTVTATDINGCQATQSYTITSPTPISITGNTTPSSCSGLNDGSISVNATGGTGTKTYTWSNGATGATISNLAAGNYTVTVTDANNCTATQLFSLTATSSVVLTGTVTNATCIGLNNGAITVNASGGSGNVSINWNTGATGTSITNLAAGTYTATASDQNGCSSSQTFTVTAPAAMSISSSMTNPNCPGSSNGSIILIVSGGSGNKTYAWSNGSTGSSITNVPAGAYSVTVSDANGCNQTQSFTLTSPNAISITGNSVNPTCANSATGSITVSAGGGSGNKTFLWSNGTVGPVANNLIAGTYSVTATDVNGCFQTQSFTLTAPPAIVITGTSVNPLCGGINSGTITAIASGGTGNKTYAWNNGITGATLTNLSSGYYTVTVTDANGCTGSQTFQLTQPTAISITGTASPVSCNGGSNGNITVNATGGTGVKTYSWNTGASGPSISNLQAGNYTVTVTDMNQCSVNHIYTVDSPAILSVNLQDFDIACSDVVGSAEVNPAGGTAPYTVNWSNGMTGNNNANIALGNYSVSIEDANGCSASADFEITQSPNLTVFAQATNVTCSGLNNGSVTVNVNGGDSNYSYIWSNGNTSNTLTNLAPGTYGVLISDGTGCEGSDNVTITEPASLNIEIDSENISCNGSDDGIASVNATGGTEPYTYTWSEGTAGSTADNLEPGDYYATITDANGCTAQAMVSISEPMMLTANIVVLSSETCAGNDGSAIVSVDGGTPGYFTQWNNGTNENTLTDAAAGTYSVVVTDSHGCLLNMDIDIPYDCAATIPSTQLIGSDCGLTAVGLNALLTCETVDNATMYQWRFTTPTGIIISDEYSLGNMFYVSQIPGIANETTYLIGVKALVDSNWGPFGNICSITTESVPNIPLPGLVAEDCGSTVLNWGEVLIAEEIPNVINYQWHITGLNYDWTTYTNINALVVEESMQLQAGETYEVQMRCAFGDGIFTDWGPICEITMGADVSVENISTESGFLLIYPNPCDGENLYFDLRHLGSSVNVEDITLYGTAGNLVEKFNIKLNPSSNALFTLKFQSTLPSGMYVLTYKLNGEYSEEKLLVR